MSYLDNPRVLFAAERTLLAWQRTDVVVTSKWRQTRKRHHSVP